MVCTQFAFVYEGRFVVECKTLGLLSQNYKAMCYASNMTMGCPNLVQGDLDYV